MQTVGLREARARFSQLIERARYQGPILLTDNRQPAAVIVSVEWYEAHKQDGDTAVNTRGSLPLIPGSE